MTKEDILKILHIVDDELSERTVVEVGGSSSMILQDFNFRETHDIDLVSVSSKEFIKVAYSLMSSNKVGSRVIDFQASGMINLVEGYDTRLVRIEDNFKFLEVLVLSRLDWVVSQLESNKFQDVMKYDMIMPEELLIIKREMGTYSGLNDNYAHTSISILEDFIKDGRTKEF